MIARIHCTCGKTLTMEVEGGGGILSCPNCGRIHCTPRVPGSGGGAGDREPADKAVILGSTLGVFLLVGALLWALAGGGSGLGGSEGLGGGMNGAGNGPGGPGNGAGANPADGTMDSGQANPAKHAERETPKPQPGPSVSPRREDRPIVTKEQEPEEIHLALEVVPEPSSPPPEESGAVGAGEPGGAGKGEGIFGGKGDGRRIVYLIDKSESMSRRKLNSAKAELVKSINTLTPDKAFFVVFFNEKSRPMPANSLVAASPENRKRIIQWIHTVSADGRTDPTDALKRAFSVQPDTIWLLSDGGFPDSVLTLIGRLNSGKNVQVNTILFHGRSGERILKRMAKDNGGQYRHVSGR